MALIKENDRKSLWPMLVKCHEHLHPLVTLDKICANHNIFEQNCSLNIFEQTTSTSEPIEMLVKGGVVSFQENINWMLRTSNVLFSDDKNMKQCFLQLDF